MDTFPDLFALLARDKKQFPENLFFGSCLNQLNKSITVPNTVLKWTAKNLCVSREVIFIFAFTG